VASLRTRHADASAACERAPSTKAPSFEPAVTRRAEAAETRQGNAPPKKRAHEAHKVAARTAKSSTSGARRREGVSGLSLVPRPPNRAGRCDLHELRPRRSPADQRYYLPVLRGQAASPVRLAFLDVLERATASRSKRLEAHWRPY